MTQNNEKAASYGYNRDGTINPDEQKIIAEIAEMRYEKGMSYQEIAEMLEQSGKLNRSGNEITIDNVSYLMKNVIPQALGKEVSKLTGNRSPAYGQMWSGHQTIVENPYEMKILREAIKLRKKGLSYQKISEDLAGRGLRNRGGQPVNKDNVAHWFRACIPNMPDIELVAE